MADPSEILHDLIDQLEELKAQGSERARDLFARVDLLRLADPRDVAYDREIATALANEIDALLTEAHAAGIGTSRRLIGEAATSARAPGSGPLFEAERSVVLGRVEQEVVALGDRLDRFLSDAMAQGMSPEAALGALEADLEAMGPRIFGDFGRAVDATLDGGMGSSAQAGEIEEAVAEIEGATTDAEITEAADRSLLIWVAALLNTCPDCLPRHGQARTMAEWRLDGLPRTGWSVCTVHCMCQLQAGEVLGRGELMAPLRRTKNGLVAGTARGLTVRVPTGLMRAEGATLETRRRRAAELRAEHDRSIEARRAYRALGRAGG